MRAILLLSILIFSMPAFACIPSQLNSCRDLKYDQIHPKIQRKILIRFYRKHQANKNIQKELNTFFTTEANFTLSDEDFLKALLKLKFLKQCKAKLCQRKQALKAIKLAFVFEKIDHFVYLKLKHLIKKTKKAKYFFQLKDYVLKTKLIQKMYLKNRPEKIYIYSDLNKKKYHQKFIKLRKLTPRHMLHLKYNYIQIKLLGKILQKLDQRIRSQQSGLFYDYDGDGVFEDQYFLDDAEQYRMSVKLLNIELERLSQSGEVFAGKKPTYMDLIAAASELGLLPNQVLNEMIELPYLFKPKQKVWKSIGKILARIGKTVIMAVPGVNLYAILPIVITESYFESQKLKNANSKLHLFSM